MNQAQLTSFLIEKLFSERASDFSGNLTKDMLAEMQKQEEVITENVEIYFNFKKENRRK